MGNTITVKTIQTTEKEMKLSFPLFIKAKHNVYTQFIGYFSEKQGIEVYEFDATIRLGFASYFPPTFNMDKWEIISEDEFWKAFSKAEIGFYQSIGKFIPINA